MQLVPTPWVWPLAEWDTASVRAASDFLSFFETEAANWTQHASWSQSCSCYFHFREEPGSGRGSQLPASGQGTNEKGNSGQE